MDFNNFKNPHVVVVDSQDTKQKDRNIKTVVGDGYCKYLFTNDTKNAIQIKEILIATLPFSNVSSFYGEGYNMLSQYGGTIENPECIGNYTDKDHYKMPSTPEKFTVYNLLILNESYQKHLLAFSSCNRFRGEFRFDKNTVDIVICLEGISVLPDTTIELEEIFFGTDVDLNKLFVEYGERVNINHPMLKTEDKVTGWCSWYCYGPYITKDLMINNIDYINKEFKELKFILIDDGYQPHMGDWIVENSQMGGSMQNLCEYIRARNMEPAIWVAPFIADGESDLFKSHPDWFVQDDNDKPLCSKDVTFEGWRCSPWYMLDTSNPDALDYLYDVFTHMKNKYGCRFFKLDANMWGALPFGKRFLKNTTCIESYRMGMKKILKAIGEDGILLGCNAPMWPSLGLVHCMRVSTDIDRSWSIIRNVSLECFHRSYQNGMLWINDPDCAVYQNLDLLLLDPAAKDKSEARALTLDEKIYQLSSLLAVGGLKIISDRMRELLPDELNIFKKFINADFGKVEFIKDDFSIALGENDVGEKNYLFFNYTDETIERELEFEDSSNLYDFWTDKEISVEKDLKLTLNPHSARIIIKLP